MVPAVGLRALRRLVVAGGGWRRLAAATGARLLGAAAQVRGDKHCGNNTAAGAVG